MNRFKEQVDDFANAFDLSPEDTERMLHHYGAMMGGCVACENSRPAEIEGEPQWRFRKCIFGAKQEECGPLFESIPFESVVQSIRLDSGLRDRALVKAEQAGIASLNGLVTHLLQMYTRE